MTDEEIKKKLAVENLKEDFALAKFEGVEIEEIGKEDLWPAFLRFMAILAILCLFGVVCFGGH